MTEAENIDIDRALAFTIPGRNARGRVVRLGPLLDEILSAHAYPPAIEQLLAEALVLTALFGAMLKDDRGQLTLQAQTEGGIVELLVCDYRARDLRGYVKFDGARLATLPENAGLEALFGKGYLAITFDQAASGERYQGIVPLEGDSLARAAESYFAQSEQIPSLIEIASSRTGAQCAAGGLLLQHLADGEDGRDRIHTRLDHPEWEHVAILGRTVKPDELTDDALPLETIVWRLFNEEPEIRVLGDTALARGCRCNPGHIRGVLVRFPANERAAMADEAGLISVDCAFCSSVFSVRADELDGEVETVT